MKFKKKLEKVIQKNNSLVCVGLDSGIDKLPQHLMSETYPQYEFNKAIIDSTYDFVCAYKLNSAFYEAQGARGIEELKMTCDYIKKNYPYIVIIIDAKRADIGSTNIYYAQFVFDYLQADAVTLHPLVGKEALEPFLKRKDKGCFFLCKTSNPGSGEFQNVNVVSRKTPFFLYIAKRISKKWNQYDNCMLVIGATYPKELKEIRSAVGSMFLLIPGIGAQGGNVKKILQAGFSKESSGGLIITASRSIIYVSKEKDFAEKARQSTIKLRKEILNAKEKVAG